MAAASALIVKKQARMPASRKQLFLATALALFACTRFVSAQERILRSDNAVRAASHTEPFGPSTNLTADQPDVPLSRPGESQIPLPPPRGRGSEGGSKSSVAGALATMILSLAAVTGIFLAAAWMLKRGAARGGASALPKEAFQSLGRAPLRGRQHAHLLRLGSKLLLVAHGPDGLRTLTEVTDADEVNNLLAICQRKDPNSATAVFRDVLKQFHREKPAPGFIDAPPASSEVVDA